MRQFNPFGIDLRLHFEKTSNEIRNEGLKGLEFNNMAAFLDYLERYKNDENLDYLIELNCKMNVNEALAKGQIEFVEQGETELIKTIITTCQMFYRQACENLADKVAVFENKRLIDADKDELAPLEKKAVNIANYCDFDVYELTYQGNKFYILYDIQKEEFLEKDLWDTCHLAHDFLYVSCVERLANITGCIWSEILKDYGFDIDKVSNPNILTWKECNDEEMEDEKHNENLEQKAKKTRGIR